MIKSGMTVGIIGGTGSSKIDADPADLAVCTTRRRARSGSAASTSGTTIMDALRDQVAVVLQKNVLFSGTIKENLRWGNADATRRGAGADLQAGPGG